MPGLLDGLNKAVSKLQDLGEKAVDGAKELVGKASPELKEGLDRAAEGAKSLYEKASPELKEGLDRVAEGAKELYGKAAPGVREGLGKVADGAKELADRVADGAKTLRDRVDAPAAPEPPKDLHAQIEEEVQAKLKQMRDAARIGDDPIHAFFQAQRQAKADAAAPQPEDPAQAALDAAEEALAEAAAPENADIPDGEPAGAEAPADVDAPADAASAQCTPLDDLAEQARAAMEKAQSAADAIPGLLGERAEALHRQVQDTALRAGIAPDAIVSAPDVDAGPATEQDATAATDDDAGL